MALPPHDRPDVSPSMLEGQAERALPRDELRRRASAGIFIVMTRGVAIALVSFGGSVVLARLLTPHDFGAVAIGMSLVLFVGMLSDGGLGAGFIRRAKAPELEELQALMGFQLAATTALALVTAAVAAPFGETGWVTALMVTSTPLMALQLPGRILLERSLSYRPLAVVELSQVFTYNASAIGLVVAGLGVWGLASAAIVRAAVAALVMVRVSSIGLLRPHLSWRRIQPLVGFGLRFQAVDATWLVRNQGLNVSIAAIAGVSTLGLWNLAFRLLLVPFLLVESLFRVSFPTMSRLVAAKQDTAPLIERAVGMTIVGSGILLTGLAGSAPGLVPGVFGEQWRGATDILPGACLGFAISGSVAVASQGYLYAVGDASAVLHSAIVHTIVLFAVTLPLLAILGVSAIGLGSLIAGVVEAAVLRRAMLRWTQVDVVRPLLAPVASGIVAGAVGWVIAGSGGAGFVSGLVGGGCSIALFLIFLTLLRRKLLYETLRFAVRSVRAAGSRSAATPAI
jgi:O-antigen/teichoic acid export membrane protein